MIAPLSSPSPIRFTAPSAEEDGISAAASSPSSPFDKARTPMTVAISSQAFEALRQGYVSQPQDAATYDKQVKAVSAMRRDILARDPGIDLAATGSPLLTNAYTAPYAATAAPLYGMLNAAPEASRILTEAVTSALPQEGQRTGTTLAADIALRHMKLTSIADNLIAPEHRQAANTIIGQLFEVPLAASPVDRPLLSRTMAIARSRGNPDDRATRIIGLVDTALNAERQTSLTEHERSELTDMKASWQAFQALLASKDA